METAWTVVGILAPFLLAVGFALATGAGMIPPEFLFAKLCFIFAGVMLGLMVVLWSCGTSSPVSARIAIGGCVGILLFVGLPEALRWIDYRQARAEKPVPHASPPTQSTPTSAPTQTAQSESDIGQATVKADQNPDRSRFTTPLKRFYAKGVTIKLTVAASEEEYVDTQMDQFWVWQTETSMWVCQNMGEYALSKLVDAKPKLDNPSSANPKSRAAAALISATLDNLQDLISNDSWDPHGAPVLPTAGCEKVIGKPTDPPFTGGPSTVNPKEDAAARAPTTEKRAARPRAPKPLGTRVVIKDPSFPEIASAPAFRKAHFTVRNAGPSVAYSGELSLSFKFAASDLSDVEISKIFEDRLLYMRHANLNKEVTLESGDSREYITNEKIPTENWLSVISGKNVLYVWQFYSFTDESTSKNEIKIAYYVTRWGYFDGIRADLRIIRQGTQTYRIIK